MTLDQVASFAAFLQQVRDLEQEIFAAGHQGWVPDYLRRSGTTLYWAWWYEFSFAELLAMALHATDLTGEFLEIAKSDEPHGGLLGWPETMQKPGGPVKRRTIILVLSMLYALIYSIKAIGYHSITIHELVTKGVAGDDVALRQAVAIDPSVLGMPSVADHVANLQVRGASKQLKQLYAAAAKGPNKQLQPYWSLRYLERVLTEGQVFELQSREAIYELVTNRLKLYDARGEDSFKGLFTAMSRWRDNATT